MPPKLVLRVESRAGDALYLPKQRSVGVTCMHQWPEAITIPVGQKLGPGSRGRGQVDGQVSPPGMGDGYAHNDVLQVVDVVVGVIGAA